VPWRLLALEHNQEDHAPDGQSHKEPDRPADAVMRASVALQSRDRGHQGTQSGENIGATDTHELFVELKEPSSDSTPEDVSKLGPSQGS
jgi:hypothetical protein